MENEAEEPALMSPDHPLLQRAQEALRLQLQDNQYRVQCELRDRQKALKDAKVKREDLGVELFGYQQQLRGIFQSLEDANNRDAQLAALHSRVADKVGEVQEQLHTAESVSRERNLQVEQSRAEVEKLAGTIRQMEDYYNTMRNKVAVTKRETYAADEALQNQEKDKQAQDSLVNHLHRQISAHSVKLARLKAEIAAASAKAGGARRDATETGEAAARVQDEVKGLLRQWREALTGLNNRDAAFQKMQAAASALDEESGNLELQIAAAARDTATAASNKAKLMELLDRVQSSADTAAADLDAQGKQRKEIEAEQQQLKAELTDAQAQLMAANLESKTLLDQQHQAERAVAKKTEAIQALKAQNLAQLQEATLAARGSQQTAQEVRSLQTEADAEDKAIAAVLSAMDTLKNTTAAQKAQNEDGRAELASLDADVADRERRIAELEAAAKQRTDLIERRTREVDALNRNIEKTVAARGPEVHSGPLEATIAHLEQELAAARDLNQALQRRWITCQRELIGLQAANGSGADRLHRLNTERVVTAQRQLLLSQKQQVAELELKQLEKAQNQQHVLLAHFDAQIAAHNADHAALTEAAVALEHAILMKLKAKEDQAMAYNAQIQASKSEKADLVKQLLAAEAQLGDWEQKVRLSNDMAASLAANGPATEDRAAARRQVHRLMCQEAGLRSAQQRLMLEIERDIAKWDAIVTKGEAYIQKHQPSPAAQSEAAGRHRIATELQRALKKVSAKAAVAQSQITDLKTSQAAAEAEEKALRDECSKMSQARDLVAAEAERLAKDKIQALLETSMLQRKTQQHEKAAKGEYRPVCKEEEHEAETARGLEERDRLISFLQQDDLQAALKPALEHMLMECLAVE